MRAGVTLLLLLLAGCQKSFDERYSDVEQEISTDAQSIDSEFGRNSADQTSDGKAQEPVD